MRIAIDARMMGAHVTRGIGRYIHELLGAMFGLNATDHVPLTFVLITRTAEHPFVGRPHVETLVADVPWYGLAEQRRMPGVFRSTKADLVHVPHWNAPLLIDKPFVLTVHDLLLRHHPASAKASTRGPLVRWAKHLGSRVVIERAVARASRIFVPSDFVARDIAVCYPHAASKVMVTGEGMPPVSRVAPFEGRTDPYLLYVGSAYPHKGLDSLLEAWKVLAERRPDMHLKIVGEKDVFMGGLERLAGLMGLRNVDFLGRVNDEALGHLYAGAEAFVFPSLFEGFGLPPLEALAAGCPVISSDAASMPEVIGPDNAVFFRAGRPDAIISAVERVLADPAGARVQARAAAVDCARRHAWSNTARLTLDAYRASLATTSVA